MAKVEEKTGRKRRRGRIPHVRRLNVRLFLLLFGLLTAGAIGVHFLHAFQVDRQANEIKLRAEKSLEAGRLADAIREFTLYLSLDPDDTDALATLGLLLEQDAVSARDRMRVFLMFERVLVQNPGRADIRSRLVDVSMKLGRYDIALGHLARLDADLLAKVAQELEARRSGDRADGDPRPFEILLASSSAENVFLGARCYDALSRYDEAAQLYLKVIDLANSEVEYYERLVELLIRHADKLPRELLSEIDPLHREDVDAATLPELLMDVVIEKCEPKHKAFLARARFRMQQRQIAAAYRAISPPSPQPITPIRAS